MSDQTTASPHKFRGAIYPGDEVPNYQLPNKLEIDATNVRGRITIRGGNTVAPTVAGDVAYQAVHNGDGLFHLRLSSREQSPTSNVTIETGHPFVAKVSTACTLNVTSGNGEIRVYSPDGPDEKLVAVLKGRFANLEIGCIEAGSGKTNQDATYAIRGVADHVTLDRTFANNTEISGLAGAFHTTTSIATTSAGLA